MFKQSLIAAIKKIHSSIETRADLRDLRADALVSFSSNNLVKVAFDESAVVKVAFDTRRINQYLDTNPRRNLQFYHRSEPFISKPASETIKTFFKLKTAVDTIKEDFIGDSDWHDSYCRLLSNALDRTLRIEQRDMDFAQPQLDYMNELLYLRYRLKDEDINRLSEKDLRNIILDRDEKLLHKQIYAQYNNGGLNKTNASQPAIVKEHDPLIDKLFGDIKASHTNKEVERSITIVVNDKIKGD